ncbi:MAG TPA: hypothetical protein VMY88_03915 [Acidimicrobiales bacterium]|nr:hypothetical protein [Acidimicrobiales bacterium]
MPIAKGENWGEAGAFPSGAPILGSDAEVARTIERARGERRDRPVCGLTGGDLWRTLGAPPGGVDRLRSGTATRAVVDVGWVRLDDRDLDHAFVAHCVARTRLWSEVLAVMNAEWLGDWDVAPKSHPGDGWLDVTDTELSWAERRKVRDRLPTGTHLPHPDVRTWRVHEAEFEFDRPRRLYVDGAPLSSARRLEIRVEPASLTVLV